MLSTDLALIELIVRFAGRLGFVLLLFGAYRLWRMPVLRKHSNQIFWVIFITAVVSLSWSLIAYFITDLSTPIFNLMLLVFNVLSTWFLAFLMHYRAHRIKVLVGDEGIKQYSRDMDALITRLKEK